MKIIILSFTIGVLFLISPYAATAVKPVPLPAVSLVNSAGEQVSTKGVGTAKGVILVLVHRGNPSGEKLLTLLEEISTPFPAEQLLIVIGRADEKVLKAVMDRHRRLAATWYQDADNLLARELNLKGTPAVIGIGNGMVAWNIPGTNDSEFLEKTMRGWLSH